MKNKLREFDKRSENFPSGVIVLILTTLDCVLMLMPGGGSSHNKPVRKGALGPNSNCKTTKKKIA